MSRKKQNVKTLIWAMAAGLLLASDGFAAEEPFYQGKTITILQGRRAGGTGSLRTEAVVKHFQKHLPGNPAVVYQFMAGAGGVAAVNHLVNVVKPDGLTIGNVSSGIISSAIVGAPAVRFKLEDLVFLGSGSAGNPFSLVIRPGLELDTVEKLRAYKGLRFANRSAGHTMYISDRVVAFILDLKEPQWILGYTDAEIRLALERGEADARSAGIPLILREAKHWLQEGFTFPLIVRNSLGVGAELYPEFPQQHPVLEQFVDTDLKKAVFRLYRASRAGASNFIVHKDIPRPALNALKEAFDKVWRDPQFAEDFTRMTREVPTVVTGDEIHELLRQIPADQKALEVYKQIIGVGPLPRAR